MLYAARCTETVTAAGLLLFSAAFCQHDCALLQHGQSYTKQNNLSYYVCPVSNEGPQAPTAAIALPSLTILSSGAHGYMSSV
jgi:hypothetical protein